MTYVLPQSAMAITSFVSSISHTDTGNPIFIFISLEYALFVCISYVLTSAIYTDELPRYTTCKHAHLVQHEVVRLSSSMSTERYICGDE